jgi:hypothetical protein
MQKESSQDRRLVKTGTPGIYRRGSRYVVVFRDPHGKQRRRSVRTLAEARDLKAALTADVRRGEYRTLSRVSFADYAAEWIESYQGARRGASGPRRSPTIERTSNVMRFRSSGGCSSRRSSRAT